MQFAKPNRTSSYTNSVQKKMQNGNDVYFTYMVSNFLVPNEACFKRWVCIFHNSWCIFIYLSGIYIWTAVKYRNAVFYVKKGFSRVCGRSLNADPIEVWVTGLLMAQVLLKWQAFQSWIFKSLISVARLCCKTWNFG